MRKKIAIVTGSGGLIGSAATKFLLNKGYFVVGIDNNMREYFFGKEASTMETQISLTNEIDFEPFYADIRDYEKMETIFKEYTEDIDIIIHTAAQPSHDWACKQPLTDFTINALGTVNLLELTRKYCPKTSFIFTSTNKVYGDRPNHSYETGYPDLEYGINIVEEHTRYEGRWLDNDKLASIDENMSIDSCKHSVFGASKVAADIMVQEYGKYFGLNTVVFRGGCLTGPSHAGTELHGFLSYLIKCMVHRKPYTVFGYKAKQVRDNIHSDDLIEMFWEYHQNPRPGEVYNAGGGRENSTSILEAIIKTNHIITTLHPEIEHWLDFKVDDTPRIGDHIWYISDLSKFKSHYPNWKGITITLEDTIKQIIENEFKHL